MSSCRCLCQTVWSVCKGCKYSQRGPGTSGDLSAAAQFPARWGAWKGDLAKKTRLGTQVRAHQCFFHPLPLQLCFIHCAGFVISSLIYLLARHMVKSVTQPWHSSSCSARLRWHLVNALDTSSQLSTSYCKHCSELGCHSGCLQVVHVVLVIGVCEVHNQIRSELLAQDLTLLNVPICEGFFFLFLFSHHQAMPCVKLSVDHLQIAEAVHSVFCSPV